MDYTSVSIKDTRDNLADIIDRVAIAGESFLVTKFGKVKALISPFNLNLAVNKKAKILKDSFGIWKNRRDMADSNAWVNKLRQSSSRRYGKIFD